MVLNTRRILLGCILAVCLALLFVPLHAEKGDEGNRIIDLLKPAFVDKASAAELTGISSVIDEAGMSAYFDAGTTIDLDDVRPIYRTIEDETADYIIGSVPVVGYPEAEDVHVYVHVDGWIVGYYLDMEPVGKIYDWVAYYNTGLVNFSTKLENTVVIMASAASVPYTGSNYYDFRFPNATNVMLVVEWTPGGSTDTFEINIPGTFVVSERSWSLASSNNRSASYYLDGVQIATISGSGNTDQGVFSVAQLLPDQFHIIGVGQYMSGNGFGGLALVYQVP